MDAAFMSYQQQPKDMKASSTPYGLVRAVPE
jgi:hypothetical protein